MGRPERYWYEQHAHACSHIHTSNVSGLFFFALGQNIVAYSKLRSMESEPVPSPIDLVEAVLSETKKKVLQEGVQEPHEVTQSITDALGSIGRLAIASSQQHDQLFIAEYDT